MGVQELDNRTDTHQVKLFLIKQNAQYDLEGIYGYHPVFKNNPIAKHIKHNLVSMVNYALKCKKVE